jgi:hypothetical protein
MLVMGDHGSRSATTNLSQRGGSLKNRHFMSSAREGHCSRQSAKPGTDNQNLKRNFGFGHETGAEEGCAVGEPLEKLCGARGIINQLACVNI